MTKAKTTKKTKKTVKTEAKTTAILRKGLRAYVGVYGAAYEAALPVFEKAAKNYNEYAAKGEVLETLVSTYAKDTNKNVRAFAAKRFEKRAAQLRSFIPAPLKTGANDRVAELETEITKLNKKIVKLSKAAPKRVTSATKKIVKTVTAA